MDGKPISASAIVDRIVDVLPADLTPQGTLFAAKAMQVADDIANLVARRHTGATCVAVGIDSVKFLNPVRQDDVLICKSSVNRSWNTSLEVGVKIIAENFRTLEQKPVLSAYFTFVCVDMEHNPIEVPKAIAEDAEQERRYCQAEVRRQERLKTSKVEVST